MVNDGFDVVDFVAVNGHVEGERLDFAIHAHFRKTVLADGFEELTIVPFPALDCWCKNGNIFILIKVNQFFDELRFRVANHFLSGDV